MPFPCNMNSVTFAASPLLGITLRIEFLNFNFINDDHMVRNSMRLVIGFWSVFNISVGHISPIYEYSAVAAL